MVGGTAAILVPYSEQTTFSREIGNAIMAMGDDRINLLLEEVTKASGYDYGANDYMYWHLLTLKWHYSMSYRKCLSIQILFWMMTVTLWRNWFI